jgi:hypothetical protein
MIPCTWRQHIVCGRGSISGREGVSFPREGRIGGFEIAAGGGAIATGIGGLSIASGGNSAASVVTSFLGNDRPALDYVAGNGATRILDTAAGVTGLAYGGP